MQDSGSVAYPVQFSLERQEKIANWRPLVHWLLAIPHLVVMNVLSTVSNVISVISWFAILFTGKLPGGLANFQAMVLRYNVRTYAYVSFMREEYPPFSFTTSTTDPGDYPPVRLDVTPQLENRNRLTSFFRIILAIPVLIVGAVLVIAACVCGIIAFFAVLFTGKWPVGLQQFVVKVMRFYLRVATYCSLLHDQYPPFALS